MIFSNRIFNKNINKCFSIKVIVNINFVKFFKIAKYLIILIVVDDSEEKILV